MAAADFRGSKTGKGARVGYSRAQLAALAGSLPGRASGPVDRYTYGVGSVCTGAEPGTAGASVLCAAAWSMCAGNDPADGLGPGMYVYRRRVVHAGVVLVPPGPWEQMSVTCLPELVPGAARQPTMAQIVAAFHDTVFARPVMGFQPVHDVTLVNLPSYFFVSLPEAGFGPGEVDSTTIAGWAVQIRPQVQSVTYDTGDGVVIGPTLDLGAAYPDGRITHAYRRAGVYRPRVTLVYTGQFRIGGGAWVDIPATVTFTAPVRPITVREARAVLTR